MAFSCLLQLAGVHSAQTNGLQDRLRERGDPFPHSPAPEPPRLPGNSAARGGSGGGALQSTIAKSTIAACCTKIINSCGLIFEPPVTNCPARLFACCFCCDLLLTHERSDCPRVRSNVASSSLFVPHPMPSEPATRPGLYICCICDFKHPSGCPVAI